MNIHIIDSDYEVILSLKTLAFSKKIPQSFILDFYSKMYSVKYQNYDVGADLFDKIYLNHRVAIIELVEARYIYERTLPANYGYTDIFDSANEMEKKTS